MRVPVPDAAIPAPISRVFFQAKDDLRGIGRLTVKSDFIGFTDRNMLLTERQYAS